MSKVTPKSEIVQGNHGHFQISLVSIIILFAYKFLELNFIKIALVRFGLSVFQVCLDFTFV